ncbi:M23 family metallopeptidase [Sphingosinicella sp. LHD-64]|uniref:M23 family metallopeptidase n=1 Tax=Sphingosinicella sp. LHD-64 TaxID=3072139 RepID=UPI00280DEB65|nr:M23 family metallopeptidase [Sphingosinicella sp. LHD-64]MDQ8754750.1 M23 family metallopeptidase [Sphingosinicella sp. LHD-64]
MLWLITGGVILFFVSMIWFSATPLDDSREAPSTAGVETALRTSRRPIIAAPSRLAIPVAGVRPDQLVDTYSQSRAGGARAHNATDIMAPAGTPVVSAADGTVEKLYFSHGGGGISAYVRSGDGRWVYYYAHLQAYAPGLREGQHLRRGDPIGLVGSTGNADPAGPHLHFAIHAMAPGERWHQGTAINPYPLLAGNGARR